MTSPLTRRAMCMCPTRRPGGFRSSATTVSSSRPSKAECGHLRRTALAVHTRWIGPATFTLAPGSGSIRKFDSSGRQVADWGKDQGHHGLLSPVPDAAGNLYVSDATPARSRSTPKAGWWAHSNCKCPNLRIPPQWPRPSMRTDSSILASTHGTAKSGTRRSMCFSRAISSPLRDRRVMRNEHGPTRRMCSCCACGWSRWVKAAPRSAARCGT